MTHADSYISTNRQRKSQARPNMKPRKRSNSGNDQRHKVTATIEAAEDLKRKLANRIGAEATTRVHDGFYISERVQRTHTQPSPNRRGYDEPLWRNNNGCSAGQGQGTAAYRRHKSNPSHRQTMSLPMSYEKPNAVAKSPENCYDLTETPWMGICPQRNL
ncbi:hypothetical protein EVAR_53196_1 [Eumeta japonica]|uniref:Uncharacterized protein n=1 Tax=Eumeta variegata TaxID=151549 RepID=A0A4C1YUT9_EUMVA|nr:hypothetical protein EVAR_53196_1 [Eumeta japonica]